jgi:DNA-directed RNA polymerase specialized sigma24 family protein
MTFHGRGGGVRQLNSRVVNGPPVAAGEPGAAGEPADFEAFVLAAEPKLRRALVTAYGYEDGREAAAEALAYAWEHWARVREMPNAAGYLFRVAQSSAARGRRWRRAAPLLTLPSGTEHRYEPGLPRALASLPERQRVAVVLVHGFGYTLREVADLTGIKITTVQNHLERGLRRLRDRLGVPSPQDTAGSER